LENLARRVAENVERWRMEIKGSAERANLTPFLGEPFEFG